MRKLQLFQIKGLVFRIVTGPIGTNTYLLETDPKIVVDPGYGIGTIVKEPCVVLLTHGHFDHICGLKELNAKKVYISREDSKHLRDPLLNLSSYFGERFVFDGTIEILTENVLNEGGLEFQIIHAPGHTPGSILLKVSDVIFSGDTIFLDSIGRTDLPSGDEATMVRTLKRLRQIFKSFRPDSMILPGHGEFGTIEYILKYNDFLKEEKE